MPKKNDSIAEQKLEELNHVVLFGFMDLSAEKNPAVLKMDQNMVRLLHAENDFDWIESLKKNYRFIVPASQWTKVQKKLKDAENSKEPIPFEHQLIRQDGTVIIAGGLIMKKEDENHSPYLHCIFFDVTSRKKMEQKKQLQEIQGALGDFFDALAELDWNSRTAVIRKSELSRLDPYLNLKMETQDTLDEWILTEVSEEDRKKLTGFIREDSLEAGNREIEFHTGTDSHRQTYSMHVLKEKEKTWLLCVKNITELRDCQRLQIQNRVLQEVAAALPGATVIYEWKNGMKSLQYADEKAKVFLPLLNDAFCRNLRKIPEQTVTVKDEQGIEMRFLFTSMIKKNDQIIHAEKLSKLSESGRNGSNMDTLVCRALTQDAVLSVCFDMENGALLKNEGRILPKALESAENWIDTEAILKKSVNMDDLPSALRYGTRESILALLKTTGGRISYDIRMHPQGRLKERERWYEFNCIQVNDPVSTHPIMVLNVMDIDKKKRSQLKQMQISSMDEQTNLLNRDAFSREYRLKSQDPLHLHAFIMADIDSFSRINGRYGHVEGDRILQQMALSFRQWARESDLVCRYGGDVFCAYIHDAGSTEDLKERVRILKTALNCKVNENYTVTVSMGISAGYYKKKTSRGGDLYSMADIALSNAKRNGGSQVSFFEPSMLDTVYSARELVPVEEAPERHVYIRTFGYFDLFVDGEAVVFRHAKAKELLALLTDRRGGLISPGDAISCLWEDEPCTKVTLSRYRKVAMQLKDTLCEYGVEDIFLSSGGQRRLDITKVNCDLLDYLSGKEEYRYLFKGSYLLNYSWSEITLADLNQMQQER